jgi:surface polysaccharide O-acyltransferase-like enzyme
MGLIAACSTGGMLVRRWAGWLVGALAAFVLWIIPTALIVKGQGEAVAALKIVADLGFVLSSATSCFALAALFLRFAAAPRPLLDSLSQHAYGIYFVHYVFVIWLQYILLNAPLPHCKGGIRIHRSLSRLGIAACAAARSRP